MVKALHEVYGDSQLSEEEFEAIRQTVVETKYDMLGGRQMLEIRRINMGKQEFGYDLESDLATDRGPIKKATNFPAFALDKSRTGVPVLKFGKAFNIAREDLLSSRTTGEALDRRTARRASIITQQDENSVIVNGTTEFGVNGLVDGAGKTTAGSSWATNDPTTDIRTGAALLDSGYTANALMVSRNTEIKLWNRNTNTDRIYRELIEAMGIRIVQDRSIDDDTAILMETGMDVAELVLAEDIDLEEEYVLRNQSWNFNTFMRSVPVIYKPNAICKITGIT